MDKGQGIFSREGSPRAGANPQGGAKPLPYYTRACPHQAPGRPRPISLLSSSSELQAASFNAPPVAPSTHSCTGASCPRVFALWLNSCTPCGSQARCTSEPLQCCTWYANL